MRDVQVTRRDLLVLAGALLVMLVGLACVRAYTLVQQHDQLLHSVESYLNQHIQDGSLPAVTPPPKPPEKPPAPAPPKEK